ncbi:putative toxin-antitoxin system toxin component, PIN family [Marinilabiliaceae bacterium ANBcel2]|nr:putative toxin-antitoxin system toxin component, PIN family [Marinilabiliaceae bacterium ANBcel2]
MGKHLKDLHKTIASGHIKIISCNEQLAELYEVFHRKKIQKYFTSNQVVDFFELLDDCAQFQKITTKVNHCRDKKDNYLLSLAIDSKADYLITGDKDLLILKSIKNTSIISYSNYSRIFK